MTCLLTALGLGRALQTLYSLRRHSLFCGPFSALSSPDGAAAWLGARGEDVWALDGIVFRVLSVATGMIRREQGDADRLVDSFVPGIIRRGRSEA